MRIDTVDIELHSQGVRGQAESTMTGWQKCSSAYVTNTEICKISLFTQGLEPGAVRVTA